MIRRFGFAQRPNRSLSGAEVKRCLPNIWPASLGYFELFGAQFEPFWPLKISYWKKFLKENAKNLAQVLKNTVHLRLDGGRFLRLDNRTWYVVCMFASTHLHEAGMDIRIIQELWGYKTTERYTPVWVTVLFSGLEACLKNTKFLI